MLKFYSTPVTQLELKFAKVSFGLAFHLVMLPGGLDHIRNIQSQGLHYNWNSDTFID